MVVHLSAGALADIAPNTATNMESFLLTRSQKFWCTEATQAGQKPKLTKLNNWTHKLTTIIWCIGDIILESFSTLLPIQVGSFHIYLITNISGCLFRLVVNLNNASSQTFVSHLWCECIQLSDHCQSCGKQRDLVKNRWFELRAETYK
jgi:hypothetical protein